MENNNRKLFELYALLLAREFLDEEHWPESLSKLSEDVIYKYINEYYCTINGEYLDIGNDKETLFNFEKEQSRYEMLCDNIKKVLANICDYDGSTVDLFVLRNLIPIYDSVYNSISEYVDKFSCHESELSKLSKEEVIEIVKEILTEVDPSLEWVELYNDILDSNVVYVNELNQEKKDLLCGLLGVDVSSINSHIRSEAGDFLLLNYNGNTSDVVNTIHEFIHYVNRRNCKKRIDIFCEFPSIFYEFYALNYLRRKSYSNDEIENIKLDRVLDLHYCILESFLMIHYVKMFIENYDINHELDISYFPLLFPGEEYPYDEMGTYVKDFCDECTMDFVKKEYDLKSVTSYIVGSYLTLNAINNLSSTLLDEIRAYTNNSSDCNLYDFFVDLGINPDEIDLKKDDKKRKRVYN